MTNTSILLTSGPRRPENPELLYQPSAVNSHTPQVCRWPFCRTAKSTLKYQPGDHGVALECLKNFSGRALLPKSKPKSQSAPRVNSLSERVATPLARSFGASCSEAGWWMASTLPLPFGRPGKFWGGAASQGLGVQNMLDLTYTHIGHKGCRGTRWCCFSPLNPGSK